MAVQLRCTVITPQVSLPRAFFGMLVMRDRKEPNDVQYKLPKQTQHLSNLLTNGHYRQTHPLVCKFSSSYDLDTPVCLHFINCLSQPDLAQFNGLRGEGEREHPLNPHFHHLQLFRGCKFASPHHFQTSHRIFLMIWWDSCSRIPHIIQQMLVSWPPCDAFLKTVPKNERIRPLRTKPQSKKK